MTSPTCLIPGAPNFRDLGGYRTQDGQRIKLGRIYRSELLIELSQDDLRRLANLGIGLVCDLRSPAERAKMSNQWPAESPYETLALDLGTELSAVQPDRWSRKLADPAFDAEQAFVALQDNYRRMPRSFAKDLHELFTRLSHADAPPVLVHCAAGKDRTGFVSAMLLQALGVSESDVLADYMETQRRYTLERLIASRLHLTLEALEITPRVREALSVLASVRTEFLKSAFDALDHEYGGTDNYLQSECGLAPGLQAKLKTRLLAPD